MKALLVADIHYRLKQFDWLVSAASGFDLVIIAGDHLDIASTVAVEAQVTVTMNYLRKISQATRLVVCSGNHDLNGRNAEGEKIAKWMSKVRRLGIPADGDSLDLTPEARVTVCPWWDGPSAKEEVVRLLARDAAARPREWHWVYHSPPAGSPTSWNGTRHYGDDDLVRWISEYRPDAVFCGHIHQSPFRTGGSWIDRIGQTMVFNAGCQIGPVPAHVTVDTTEGVAHWHSLSGSERVRLDDEALERELVD